MTAHENYGTIKISQGLYIGDQFSSKDIDTLVMNHITHIVNCESQTVPNHFQSHGVVYLCFQFASLGKEIVLDTLDKNISTVVEFIQEARQQGESVLIHCSCNYTTALVFYCAYLMQKYRWGLYKTVQFLESRITKMELNDSLARQLRGYQGRLINRLGVLTSDWKLQQGVHTQQVTLRNTYINSFLQGETYKDRLVSQDLSRRGIIWIDEHPNIKQYKLKESIHRKGILKNTGQRGSESKCQQPPRPSLSKIKDGTRQPTKMFRGDSEKNWRGFQDSSNQHCGKPRTNYIIQQNSNQQKQPNPNQLNTSSIKLLEERGYSKELRNHSQKQNQNYPEFSSLFRHQTAKELLIKSTAMLVADRPTLDASNNRFDTDSSHTKEAKLTIRDQITRKELRKMIIDKGSSLSCLQGQQPKRKDILSRGKCQSELVIKKPKRPIHHSQRVSEESHKTRESSSRRVIVNNFVRERPSRSRPQSPAKGSTSVIMQVESQSKIDVERAKPEHQEATEMVREPPSQNRLSLKEASTLLSSIFPRNGYKPKWRV